ncbi:MAG TPA: DUF1045 domain-containing protein [Methylomirabilota bacterium]|nr:DUF1045 domain-containing protein [Methylomirabilota bacterium]
MRYAVYFTPSPDKALAAAGAGWLGRDAFTGELLPQPVVPSVDPERLRVVTADPRRYGFHATLKPPFQLASDAGEADLVAAFADFAASRPAFETRLEVGRLGGFLALVPAGSDEELRALADAAVVAFDRFRAPLAAAELERRRRGGMTAVEDDNLVRWGYPYVFDAFRFHMTLSHSLADPELAAIETAARAWFDEIVSEPTDVDTLGLFVERDPGGPFMVLTTASLDPSSS